MQFTLPASNILHAKGLTSGLVLDLGEISTTMTPIVDGFILTNSVKRSASMSAQTLLDSLIEQVQREKSLCLRTTYEREVIGRDMLMLRQPEVKKGILPYQKAKKRQEGAYVLPDGRVVDDVAKMVR